MTVKEPLMAKTKDTFDFEVDGVTYSIPAFNKLPIGAVRKARKAKDDADMAFTLIEIAVGEGKELDALDSMDSEQFSEFLQGWTQGAGVGEASSSES